MLQNFRANVLKDLVLASLYPFYMAARLCDVVVVVVVGRTRARSMPLTMLTTKKDLHGSPFLCMHVVLF